METPEDYGARTISVAKGSGASAARARATSETEFLRAAVGAALGIVLAVALEGIGGAQVVVYPTGVAAQDVANVQGAVNLGGTVILKAVNVGGAPTAFDFGDVERQNNEFVEITNDVRIQGENLGSPVSYSLPNGEMIESDRSVVYGGGRAFSWWSGTPKGSFNIAVRKNFVIEGLRFDSSHLTAVSVSACDGNSNPCRFSDNVVTDVVAEELVLGLEGAFGCVVSELWGLFGVPCAVAGDIIIENNEIDVFGNDPSEDPGAVDYSGGAGIFYILSGARFHIRNNIIRSPGNAGVWVGGIASSIAWIEGNEICQRRYGFSAWLDGVDTGELLGCGGGEVHISGNRIEDAGGYSISVSGASNSTIAHNLIERSVVRGIYLGDVTDSVVENNTIDSVIAPAGAPWWNGAFAIDYGGNNVVQRNTISGEGRSAVHLWRTSNNVIAENDCSGFSPKLYSADYDPLSEIYDYNLSYPLMTLAQGVYGAALDFKGAADYVELPDMGKHEAVSVALWMRAAAGGPIGGLVSSDGWYSGIIHFKYELGEIKVDKCDGGGIRFPANLKQWYHVVYTCDAVAHELKLYVDGDLKGTVYAGTTPNDLSGLKIGREYGGRYFQGSIDEVGIWNRALSGAEIELLYAWGVQPWSFVAYYDCDSLVAPGAAGEFQLLPDQSGNGRHGLVNPHFCDRSDPRYVGLYDANVCCIWLDQSSNNTVTDNIIGQFSADVVPEFGATACVELVHLDWHSVGNEFIDNDYTKSGLQGWGPESAGSVLLDQYTEDNLVFEVGDFMRGTGGAKEHVLDLGVDNRVVGHKAGTLAQQEELNPGIGRRKKEALGALQEAEEEPWRFPGAEPAQ